MTRTLFACLGATVLLFGCSQAGIRPTDPTGTGGAGNSGGTTGSGGTSSGSAGTGGSLGFDASLDISVGDTKSDGVCSSESTAAEPVPLDLFVMVDVSKSMARAMSSFGRAGAPGGGVTPAGAQPRSQVFETLDAAPDFGVDGGTHAGRRGRVGPRPGRPLLPPCLHTPQGRS